MNREIKFRGLRTDGKGWVYGFYVYRPDGIHLIYFKPFEGVTTNTYFQVTPESVGQFTVLKDKNGLEIYEGDEVLYREAKGVVRYCEKTAMFEVYFELLRSIYSFDSIEEDIEIIGNIHEK